MKLLLCIFIVFIFALQCDSKLFRCLNCSKAQVSTDCKVVIVGAGIGGIYSAYRLAVESKAVPPKNICILEAQNRPGGRIFTVKGMVPSFEDFTVDLGAYRYGRSRHWMMRSIIEDVLEYDWQCYTDPLDRSPKTCPSSTNRILSTRGLVYGLNEDGTDADDAFKSYSPRLPYQIPKIGQWGINKSLKKPRTPSQLLVGPRSVIPEISGRWRQFESEKNYSKAMKIADQIIAQVTKGGNYKGTPYYKISLWQLAREEGYDMEELKLYIDQAGPVTPYTLHTNVERLITVQLREAAMEKADLGGYKGLVTPVITKNGIRRRAGMSILFEGLLKKVVRAGVNIKYNHRVGRIRRFKDKSKELIVELQNGQAIKTQKVIINAAKRDLESFGITSEPVQSSNEEVRKSISRIIPMPGSKAYCFWDDAWWVTKLNITHGVFKLSDGTLYQGRYHDGDVVCKSPKSCRGALLISYSSGSVNNGVPGSYVRSLNEKPFVPLVKSDAMIRIIPGKMSRHQSIFFNEIHRQLRNAHSSTFMKLGYKNMLRNIPNARGCLISDWMDYGHQVDVGSGQGGNDNRRFSKPVHDLDISLVNEGWSEFRGWAEGSLISAERALHHSYGLARPSWMDSSFHYSVIKLFNRGRKD